MKVFSFRTKVILSLLVISLVFYLLNYLVFEDPPFMLRLFTLQFAFMPISVILLTFILNAFLLRRERRDRLSNLNMVIGTFFSEVGTDLLKFFSDFNLERAELSQVLVITSDWTDKDYDRAKAHYKAYDYKLEMKTNLDHLEKLKEYMLPKREFQLRLLENPNMLEHEAFTDLLWAVFHLTEELAHRVDLRKLPDNDYQHLSYDMKRAYGVLVSQWLAYMQHMKDKYPYLYSLAIRTNPLNPNAVVEIV